jgi:DNA-binding MarR family transcriptional regulator
MTRIYEEPAQRDLFAGARPIDDGPQPFAAGRKRLESCARRAVSISIVSKEGRLVTSAKEETSSHIDDITAQWKHEYPDVDLSKLLLPVYLQRLGRMIDQDFERYCLTQFKMRASDMRVLLALRRIGPPYAKRPTDLFRSLLVTSGAITKQVDRLEKKKLVKRLPDPSYSGGFLVQLTDRGRKIIDEVVEGLREGTVVVPVVWDVSEAEREQALAFCYRAISLIENSPLMNGQQAKPGRTGRGKAAKAPVAAQKQA